MEYIQTAFGRKSIIRRVASYAFTMPRAAAPNGEWWREVAGEWIPVGSNNKGLLSALATVST